MAATTGAPAPLGVRMGAAFADARAFDYVRIDVLPAGVSAGAAPTDAQLLAGDEPHVRRYEATAAQLASDAVSFAFDGRDDSGRALRAGTYDVGFVVRTRSTDPACTDAIATKWGHLTTVLWQPA